MSKWKNLFIKEEAPRMSVRRFWFVLFCLTVITASYLLLVLTENMGDVFVVVQAAVIILLVSITWLNRPDDYRDPE